MKCRVLSRIGARLMPATKFKVVETREDGIVKIISPLTFPRLGVTGEIALQGPKKALSTLPQQFVKFLETVASSDIGPSVKRSTHWGAFLRKLIDAQPYCSLCGNTNKSNLTGHHITPVWVNPYLELDPQNIIILCDSSEALAGLNCHLVAGHLGNWRLWNPRVRDVCEDVLKLIQKGKLR